MANSVTVYWPCSVPTKRAGYSLVAGRKTQRGLALMVLLTLVTLFSLSLFIGQFSVAQLNSVRAQAATAALAEAKQALIGSTISQPSINDTGYLDMPDLGIPAFGTITEGQSSGTFAAKNISVIGKFPWRTLATTTLHGQDGECLWYALSGRFKKSPATDTLNWDTQGQIDVIDGNGNVVATNLAALLIAPGPALDGQDRMLADPSYARCGGNYDARNYMDSYESADAVSGEVNYYAGSTNNRVAADTGNKRFVATDSAHYNDQFLYVTSNDIFLPFARRSDFSVAIGTLLDNPSFKTIIIDGVSENKRGTDNLDCDSDVFCENWKEMLFLKEIQTPAPITIDGSASGNCARVLFFSGRKGAGQSRSTATEKSDVNNYLEGTNASSFNVASAPASDFSGASTFDWSTPETDLVRCLQ